MPKSHRALTFRLTSDSASPTPVSPASPAAQMYGAIFQSQPSAEAAPLRASDATRTLRFSQRELMRCLLFGRIRDHVGRTGCALASDDENRRSLLHEIDACKLRDNENKTTS